MYRVLNKRRKIVMVICLVIAVVLLAIWGVRVYQVNTQAFRQTVETYEMGETVSLDGNFFFESAEDTAGYSICVNSAELKDYTEFMKAHDGYLDTSGAFPRAKYVYLLNLTVKNTGNADGYLSAMGFALYHGALQIPIDFEVWNLIDKSIDGNMVLKLREDSEVTLTLPFTAQSLDEATNSEKLNRMLENETFGFCVSDFPTRKMILVKAENAES